MRVRASVGGGGGKIKSSMEWVCPLLSFSPLAFGFTGSKTKVLQVLKLISPVEQGFVIKPAHEHSIPILTP